MIRKIAELIWRDVVKSETRLSRIEAALLSLNASQRLQRKMLSTLHTLTTAYGEGIMGKIDELEQSVTDLQGAVDSVTEAVTTEQGDLQAITTELTKLREAAANGGFVDAARFDALIERTQTMRSNLENAVASIGGLAPTPEPPAGGEGGEGGEVVDPPRF